MQGGNWPPTWVVFFSKGHNMDSLHVILLEKTKLLLMGQGGRTESGRLLGMRSGGMPTNEQDDCKGRLDWSPTETPEMGAEVRPSRGGIRR